MGSRTPVTLPWWLCGRVVQERRRQRNEYDPGGVGGPCCVPGVGGGVQRCSQAAEYLVASMACGVWIGASGQEVRGALRVLCDIFFCFV